LYLVGILSSRFAHDARSQKHKDLGRSINRVLFISYCIVFYVDCILMDATRDSSYCSHQLAAVRHL